MGSKSISLTDREREYLFDLLDATMNGVADDNEARIHQRITDKMSK